MTKKDFNFHIREALAKSKNTTICIQLDDEFKEAYNKYWPEIMKRKVVESIEVMHGSWIDTLVIRTKPCKAYTKLANYLNKIAQKGKLTGQLHPTKLFFSNISGKRSSYDIEDMAYLQDSARQCGLILKWLMDNNATTADSVTITYKSGIHWGDRFNSYGEDMECEWNGYEYSHIHIVLKTKTGRVRNEEYFYLK